MGELECIAALRTRAEAAEADAAALRKVVADLIDATDSHTSLAEERRRMPGIIEAGISALAQPHPGGDLLAWVAQARDALEEAKLELRSQDASWRGDDYLPNEAAIRIDAALALTPAQAGERVARLERVAEAAREFVNRRGCMRCHGTGQAHVRYAALGISMNEADPDCPNCRSLRQALADMEVGGDG